MAIDGVFRATPVRKGSRTFTWYSAAALARTLPDGWRPTTGSIHTALPGQIDGLHCQTGHRVLTCVSGRVALVVLDIRVGAPTFGRWIPIDLDTVERVSVIVPADAAWGFQAVTTGAAVLTLHNGEPDGLGIDPTDPSLAIAWPARITHSSGAPVAEVMDLLPRYER